jgi:hypothetical protein
MVAVGAVCAANSPSVAPDCQIKLLLIAGNTGVWDRECRAPWTTQHETLEGRIWAQANASASNKTSW